MIFFKEYNNLVNKLEGEFFVNFNKVVFRDFFGLDLFFWLEEDWDKVVLNILMCVVEWDIFGVSVGEGLNKDEDSFVNSDGMFCDISVDEEDK